MTTTNSEATAAKYEALTAKLKAEHEAGMARDLYDARLAGDPRFAKAEAERHAAEWAERNARLDALRIEIPVRKVRSVKRRLSL